MSRWTRGDIVVVAFPYTEATGEVVVKGRPALVISGEWVNQHTEDVIVAAISSRKPARTYPTDFRIEKGSSTFGHSGLRVSSTVKGAVVATIPQTVVTRRLGKLNRPDMEKVDKCLRSSLEL